MARNTKFPYNPYRRVSGEPVTWFLVANEAYACVYVRKRVAAAEKNRFYKEEYAQELVPVAGMSWRAERRDEYPNDDHFLERVFELNFAHIIATQLHTAERANAFDRLVLISSPEMLDDLKRLFSEEVLVRVAAELPRGTMRHDEQEMTQKIEEMF